MNKLTSFFLEKKKLHSEQPNITFAMTYLDTINDAVSVVNEIAQDTLDFRRRYVFTLPSECVAGSVFEE